MDPLMDRSTWYTNMHALVFSKPESVTVGCVCVCVCVHSTGVIARGYGGPIQSASARGKGRVSQQGGGAITH